MGKIFYIIGKSATGKDHVYAKLAGRDDLGLKKVILYTTRPMRDREQSGREYFFVDEQKLREFEQEGKLIENRAYHTVHGIWNYFTADDGQIDLNTGSYLGIGTLESYVKLKKYYGDEAVIPIYLEVETGERLTRALTREKKQEDPKYAEMCRRFLADEADFSEDNIAAAGISKRFENVDIDECVEAIIKYIKTVQ